MTILDQPIVIEEEVPRVKRWTWFEKTVPAVVLILTILREIFGFLWADEAIMMTATLMGICYLVAHYWIDRPSTRSAQTIIVSILYGVCFFSASFAFIMLILFLPGGKEMSLVTLAIFTGIVIIDIVWANADREASKKVRVLNKHTIIRGTSFAVILAMLNIIPESTHILSIYRKYPGFINYYKEHQEDGKFMKILYDYTQLNKIPQGELR